MTEIKTITFDFKEFKEWFDDICEFIGDGRTTQELGDDKLGGNVIQVVDENGVHEHCNLWFGGTEPSMTKYTLLKSIKEE